MTTVQVLAPQRGRAPAMVLLGVALGLVLADVAAGVISGSAAQYVFPIVSFTLAMIGMLVAGLVLVRDRLHAGLGVLLFGVAAGGALFDLTGILQDLGPMAFLQPYVYWGYAGLLTHVLVRWPDRRISSTIVRGLVLAMYLVMPVLTVVWQLTWDRRWFGAGTASWWWLTVLPARDFSATVWQIQQGLFVALIAAFVVVVIVRATRARGSRRIALVPVTVVGVALALTVAAEVVGALGASIPFDAGVAQNFTLLAIPIGVLIAATRSSRDGQPVPGRRLPPGDPVRSHYRLGLAAIAASAVVLFSVVVLLTTATDGANPSVPAPVPGPALVAQ